MGTFKCAHQLDDVLMFQAFHEADLLLEEASEEGLLDELLLVRALN